MFGLTGGASLLCALLFWRLRWYRTATWAAAVLWLGVALLMLLGVGETGGGGGAAAAWRGAASDLAMLPPTCALGASLGGWLGL